MVWFSGWDDVFTEKEWGKYPGEELIRFIARNFYRAPDRADVHVFEIGCGTGANIWYLAREGFSAHGLDGSQVAIDRAKARLAAEGLDADLRVGDAMALPYADDTFDAVIDVECIYSNSLADSRKMVAEAYRVLKPGALFYSKTFATGMAGEDAAETLPGEPHTYLGTPDTLLQGNYGIVRLMDEDDIQDLYGDFADLAVDYVEWTDRDRGSVIREWIVTGRKPA